MKSTEVKQMQEKKWYKVILVLFVGLAAFSSAMKELNEFQTLTTQASQFVAEWVGVVMPTADAHALPTVEICSNAVVAQSSAKADEFRWNGRVAPGSALEIRGINGDISAEPATGSEVEVVALKKSRRSDVNSVEIKVVEHAGGVTICAIYPNDDSTNRNTCEPGGSGDGRNSSANVNVRNNDVRVDFTVRVPRQVGFIARTINGEIGATALASNIVSRTVNGSIKISTSGYAEAQTINGEISAKLGDANWPQALTFTTLNGEIALDLPADTSADVKAETLNGTINSDFPLSLRTTENRRKVSGRIGTGGRELVLKTLNGSINLRRAS
jgi:DUF4097 and DUF4098 domain-containing protein YvlB